MKLIRVPLTILTLFTIGFLFYLFQSTPELPVRVAVHFGGDGHATGWMRRSDYRLSMEAIGIGLPLFLALCGTGLWFLFSRLAHRPGQEGLASSEDHPHAGVYLLRYLLWLGSWGICFIAVVQYFIIDANRSLPADLSVGSFSAVTVTFLAGVVIWIARLGGALRSRRDPSRQPVA